MSGAGTLEPHFWAGDLSASRRFYEEALGFSVKQHFPEDAPSWFQMERGPVLLMLATRPAAAEGHQAHLAALEQRRGGGAVSLYLHVDDADAELARCDTAGADVIEPIWNPWWGGRQFSVADPDGNWWTIYQRIAPAAS